MQSAVDAPTPCRFLGDLVSLLDEVPTEHGRRRAEATAERLSTLEHAARWHGAPESTLSAIRSARVLLSLAEMPPFQTVARAGASR
ncbi:hypothetical protein [Methylobacterium fujisawaense]